MKNIVILLAFLVLAGSALAKDVRVKGYYRDSDGDGYRETYVKPYTRMAPDNSIYNNYSTRGNVNPYTNERGTVNPENTYRSNSNQYKSFYGK